MRPGTAAHTRAVVHGNTSRAVAGRTPHAPSIWPITAPTVGASARDDAATLGREVALLNLRLTNLWLWAVIIVLIQGSVLAAFMGHGASLVLRAGPIQDR